MLGSFGLITTLALASCAVAAEHPFSLGEEYTYSLTTTESVAPLTVVDRSGSVYLARAEGNVEKYLPGGFKIWSTQLSFTPYTLAVDPAGRVYVTSNHSPETIAVRLDASGKLGSPTVRLAGISVADTAVGDDGRLWLTGSTTGPGDPLAATPGAFQRTLSTIGEHGFVARLNEAGTAIEYVSYLGGSRTDQPTAIAVDQFGSAVVTGCTNSVDFPLTSPAVLGNGCALFVTRFKPDGTGLVYSVVVSLQSGWSSGMVAVDGFGNAAVSFREEAETLPWTLARLDVTGATTFRKMQPEVSALAMDADGTIYFGGPAKGDLRVKNNLSTCGSAYLSALDTNGEVLQSTWMPSAQSMYDGATISIALGADGTVHTLVFGHSRINGGGSIGQLKITKLSPLSKVDRLQVACVTDAAVYRTPADYGRTNLAGPTPAGIAPGQLLSIFGNGLGPSTATQPATVEPGFPQELGEVQVLFNHKAAALIYVQESQINVVAPWSLPPGESVEVCVRYKGISANCLTAPVVDAAPAVFRTRDIHAAAVNQDGSINSADRPAPLGSIISIFATGLGPLEPAVQDGEVVGVSPPKNTLAPDVGLISVSGIGGSNRTPLKLQYAGPAPYQVAGVSQLNIVLPNGAASGVFSPRLFLTVAGVSGEFTVYVGGTR